MKIRAIEFKEGMFRFLNQTKLPLVEEWIVTDDYERISAAIEKLEVRGAPAIGISAAFALSLAFKNILKKDDALFQKVYSRISSTRPTAVNLFYGLDEIKKVYESNSSPSDLYTKMISRAIEIHEADIKMCDEIAKNGLHVFSKKSRVLTHCNAGALATGGDGTALNVIRYAFEKKMVEFVHADETRPLLQGSRLTAWELNKYEIPFAINTDSTAAFLMKDNKVDLVIVGADRIAQNGDAANKIGTYNLAVLCKYHNIPFYIAAPTSTVDRNCVSGNDIKIELRDKKELFWFGEKQITSNQYNAFGPAFDVTPHELITAIITEKRVHKPPYSFKNV